jgi:hypothetical protein
MFRSLAYASGSVGRAFGIALLEKLIETLSSDIIQMLRSVPPTRWLRISSSRPLMQAIVSHKVLRWAALTDGPTSCDCAGSPSRLVNVVTFSCGGTRYPQLVLDTCRHSCLTFRD